jgi:hypothetical protein
MASEREYRHTDKSDTENTEREQDKSKVDSQWPKSACSLRRRLNIGDSGHIERDGGREDDEVSGKIGIKHPAPSVPLYAPEFGISRGRVTQERRCPVLCAHFFDLFGGLPKEEVRTDCGAKDANDHGRGIRI